MRLRVPKKDLIAVLFMLIFTLVYFGHFLLTGNEKILSSPRTDLASSGFYYSELGFSLLKRGEAPLWNPYIFCGVPLLAGLQAAFYYPLRWVSLFMGEARAINISFILHFFLGSLFLYVLLRHYKLHPFPAMLSGIIFSFSAIPVLHLYAGHACDIWTMVWIPLVILFLDLTIHPVRDTSTGSSDGVKRRGIRYPIFGGIVLGLQILACHPQHVYYTILAGGIYLLFHIDIKKSKNYYCSLFGKLILFLVVALGISAIQLLPSLEMVKNSGRMAGLNLSWIGQNSLPPENFLTMLFPGFLGDLVSSPYLGRWYLWENCLYLGAGALLFGSMALFFSTKDRKTYFAFGIVFLGLFLATGKYNPVFPYLVRFFPGFSMFRGHAKFIYLYGFGLAILAGYGLEYLFTPLETLGKRKFLTGQSSLKGFILTWVIIALILGGLAIYFLPPGSPSPLWNKILSFSFAEGERYEITTSDFMRGDFVRAYNTMQKSVYMTLSFIGLILLGIYLATKKMKFSRIFLAVIICADLFIFGQKYLVSFSIKNIIHKDPVINFLKKDRSYFRTGEITPGLLNRGIYHRLFSVGGYAGNILSRYSLFVNLAQNLPLDSMELVLFLKSHSSLLNGINLKYILSPSSKRINHPDFSLAYEDGVVSVYENKKALPRAYLVPEVITATSEEEVLKRMLSPDFHFLRCAIVEGGETKEARNIDSVGEATITRYESNEVEINVDSEKDSFLVLADMYYPGWKAYIDGERVKLFPTDYIFRGVKIPGGSHNVLFRYEPWTYKVGAFVTMLTILSVLVITIVNKKF